jgi:prophage tail gpP-like protein
MPFKADEVAEITIEGSRYRDWESVTVHMVEGEPNHSFKLSVSEGAPLASKFAALRIKPGDHCTVTLAGELAISGYVETRQVAYTASQHGVELIGHSYNKALADGAVMHKTMEWKDKPYKTIADDITKPFGIKFNPLTQISGKPFKRVNVAPGTSAWEQLDTLARKRGITLGTDKQGNITGRTEFTPGGDRLVEGVNILEGREVLTKNMGDGQNYNYDQEPGSDQKWGPKVTHDANGQSSNSNAGGGKGVYAPNVTLGEHPGDKQDSQTRADMESDRRDYEKFEVTIVVQGWLKPSGGLWHPGDMVHVTSPMLIVDEDLKLMSADFTQDSKSGTRTTLVLTKNTDSSKYNYDPASGNTGDGTSTGTSSTGNQTGATTPALGE